MAKIGDTEVLRSTTWGTDPRAAPDFENRFSLTPKQFLPGEELIGIWTHVPPIPMGNRWWPLSMNCGQLCDWYCGFGAYCCYKAKWNESYPPGLPWLVRPHLCHKCCPFMATGIGEPVFQGWPWCGDSECYCPLFSLDIPTKRLCCLCPPDGCSCLWCRCVCWPKLWCCYKWSKGHTFERIHIDELSLDKDMRDVEARVPFNMHRLVLTTRRAVFEQWDETRDLKDSHTLWRRDLDTLRYHVIRQNARSWAPMSMKKGGFVSKIVNGFMDVVDLAKSFGPARFCLNAPDEKRLAALKAQHRYDFYVSIEFFWKLSSHQMQQPTQDLEWRVQTLGDEIESIRMGLERFITGEGNYVKPPPKPPLRMPMPPGMGFGLGVGMDHGGGEGEGAGTASGTARTVMSRPPAVASMSSGPAGAGEASSSKVAPAEAAQAEPQLPVVFQPEDKRD